MKKYLIVLIMVVVVLFTISCETKEVTNLKFRITWDENSGRGDAIKIVVNDFNKSHKYTQIEMIGGNENFDEYESTLLENNVDIYVMPYRYIQNEKIANELYPLGDNFTDLEQYYYESTLEMSKFENKLLGIPWIGHSMAIIYNKDITDEVKIKPERWKSLDDFLKSLEKVSENTDSKGLGLVGGNHHDLTWMVSQFIYSFGGQLVELDENKEFVKVDINSEETKEALDFYINKLGPFAQEGWEEDSGVEVMEAFAKSEIAFEIQGPWGVTDIWKKGYPFEVGVIPLSQIGMYSEVGPLMLTVSKDSLYVEDALEFVKFMNEIENLDKIMAGEYVVKYDSYYPFRVPIRKDMINSDFFAQYPEFYSFIEGFNMPSINTPCSKWQEIQEVNYPTNIHEAIMGNITIEEALELIK